MAVHRDYFVVFILREQISETRVRNLKQTRHFRAFALHNVDYPHELVRFGDGGDDGDGLIGHFSLKTNFQTLMDRQKNTSPSRLP